MLLALYLFCNLHCIYFTLLEYIATCTVYIPYILPYVSITLYKNGSRLRTAECSLHEGSHYLAVLHEDKLPVIPLFNTHRNDTEICHQQAFHLTPFGIFIDLLSLHHAVNSLPVTIQIHAVTMPSASILNCAPTTRSGSPPR